MRDLSAGEAARPQKQKPPAGSAPSSSGQTSASDLLGKECANKKNALTQEPGTPAGSAPSSSGQTSASAPSGKECANKKNALTQEPETPAGSAPFSSGKEQLSEKDPFPPKRRMTVKAAVGLAAPHTWPASLCPALFGIFWCLRRALPLSPVQGILLTAACILAQSSVNTLNDYADFVSGADAREDNVEEEDAVLVYGNAGPEQALRLGIGFLILAGLFGSLASFRSGPVPFIIGAVGGLTVLGYSVSPLPIASLPLGEAVSGFVMGGLIPMGIAGAADGRFHPEILPECLPMILGIALIMLSNNGSDIEKDIAAGRTTLPVRLGRSGTLALYRVILLCWLLALCIQPLYRLGFAGLAGILPACLFGRKAFGFLLKARLLPRDRIRQMKSVAAANLVGNGFLSAAYAAAWLLGSRA